MSDELELRREVSQLRSSHRDSADHDSAGRLMLALNNLAALVQDHGETGNAIELLRDAVAVGNAIPGRVDLNQVPLATVLVNLAELLRRSGDRAAARRALESAAEAFRAHRAAESAFALHLQVLIELSRSCLSDGDSSAAWQIVEEARALAVEAEPKYRLAVETLWAAAAEGSGDLAKARTGLERALDIEEFVHDGTRQAQLARANLLNRLGRCQLSLGELEATVATLEEVVSICQRLGGEHAPAAVVNLYAAARNRLGRAHKKLGSLDAAELHLRASVAMMREIARAQPVADVIEDLVTALHDLGEVLIAGEAPDEGRRLIAEGDALMARLAN